MRRANVRRIPEKAAGPPNAPLKDGEERRRIEADLDRTIFVEAGAGSGKTKSLVDRMIALLRAGRCSVARMAAVTFTRKAAAELRERFQIELEKSVRREPDAEVRERLREALRNLEQCSIGTIHSFCARLLRERPVEIGLDPDFEEMEEIDDAIFRAQCWADYLVRARVEGLEALRGLEEAGVDPKDLEKAFEAVSLYPEVKIVGGRTEIPDYPRFRRELEDFLERARKALPKQKPAGGYDDLQRLILRCLRRKKNLGFDDRRVLMETYELLEKKVKVTQKKWGSKEEALAFQDAFDGFQEGVVVPALCAWREFRHGRVVAFLEKAVAFFDLRRREENRLNFGDLLILAARLLRDNPEVRRYFSERYTHVLVDEFQDTDPIQAEVLMYLKGENLEERDWQKLRPKPGSMFLVGDPKQSIYRFRRADIDIYNRVKEIVARAGGEVLNLTTNFRSLETLAAWNNPIWERVFPEKSTRYQAAFAPIEPHRKNGATEAGGVFKIVIPKIKRNKGEEIAAADAAIIADWIARACHGDGIPEAHNFRPSDFLVLFRYKKHMDLYARALEERGIPFEITGSDAFAASEEIGEITNLARALGDPDNPIFTVAVLRGIFCGVSDEDLVEFRREGGRFHCLSPGLEFVRSKHLGATNVLLGLQRLRAWREWTLRLPPSAALQKIFEDSGMVNYLVSKEMGSSRAGNMLKLLEIVRNEERKGETSFMRVVKLLEELAGEREVEEISLTPARRDAVRLMNLHKAKGLEARVVFLANPAPSKEHEVDRHIVRIGDHPEGSGAKKDGREDGRPRGYFAFHKPGTFRSKGDLISHPVGWQRAADEERKYLEAEEERLMYVAATRARDMLVVSTYEGDARNKPWKTLDAALGSAPELKTFLLQGARRKSDRRGEVSVSKAELLKARKAMAEKYELAARPTYLVETVTALSRKDREGPARRRDPGLGLSWGRLVHHILEAIGSGGLRIHAPGKEKEKDSGGDEAGRARLAVFVENLLAAEEGDFSDRERLVAHVMSILESDFWQRIERAEKRYFEIPFSIRTSRRELASSGGCAGDDLPLFLSGTIDLVFWEGEKNAGEKDGAADSEGGSEAGWVIVDYKTDLVRPQLAEEDLDDLVRAYAPQVLLYARFWSRMTGEPVKEAGLYFTSINRWVEIPGRGISTPKSH